MPNNSTPPPLADVMDAGWAQVMAPVEPQIRAMGEFLRGELEAGRSYLPAGDNVFRAFRRPFCEVKVLIVGQDPYPTPGHAMGLSFSVPKNVLPLPKSLGNIFTELAHDTGIQPPTTGDLTPLADQGVFLLNRVLTVAPGNAGSHRNRGWEPITEHAIRALAAREQPLVGVLWGRDAASVAPILAEHNVPYLTSAHPSPLSAHRGFFGSRPFSKVNALLAEQGASPVDWQLP